MINPPRSDLSIQFLIKGSFYLVANLGTNKPNVAGKVDRSDSLIIPRKSW